MRRDPFAILVLLVLLTLSAGPATAKVPSEVLVQGVGLPYAARITDEQTRMRVMEIIASSPSESPIPAVVLLYRHVVYLLFGSESPSDTEWRYFYQPGTGSSPGYLFRVRPAVVNIDGNELTYAWTTLQRPAGLDDLLEPYLSAEASQARYVVGDPPPSVAPPREISDLRPVLPISPAFVVAAGVVAATLAALTIRLPQRARVS